MFGCESESIVLDRLEALGADLDNVHWLGRVDDDSDLLDRNGAALLDDEKPRGQTKAKRDWELRLDLLSLEQHLLDLQSEGCDVQLVIIDPIESLLRDAIDKGRFAERLRQIADKTGVAIVAVGLTTSTPYGRCGFRTKARGFETLVQVARSVLTVAPDLENGKLKVCGKTARTVRREEGTKSIVPSYPHLWHVAQGVL